MNYNSSVNNSKVPIAQDGGDKFEGPDDFIFDCISKQPQHNMVNCVNETLKGFQKVTFISKLI